MCDGEAGQGYMRWRTALVVREFEDEVPIIIIVIIIIIIIIIIIFIIISVLSVISSRLVVCQFEPSGARHMFITKLIQ